MELEDIFAFGMMVGGGLLLTIVGAIKFALWCGSIQNRVAMIEAQLRNFFRSLQMKGKTNENTNVAGQTPAGPKKTS